MKIQDLKLHEKESDIQRRIIKYLDLLERTGSIYFFRSGCGMVSIQTTGKNNRIFKTGKVGCPDISLVLRGTYIGLEVKNKKGKMSENQKQAQQQIEKAGGYYFVVRSIEDVKDVIRKVKNES